MNYYQQEEKFNELKKELDRLNTQFEQIMTKNNLTKQDLALDENTLPKEVKIQWDKIKNTIEQQNTFQEQNFSEKLALQQTNTTSFTRKNALRL